MRAARWCLVAALAASLVACGDDAQEKASLIGTEITFEVPVARGESQTIRLQGIERGSGPNGVVLAHMLGSSQNAWAPIVEDLVKDGFHVLTFDFRGHGLSGGDRDPSRADLDFAGAVAKLRALGATKVLAVGASMGGTAALADAVSSNLAGVVTISAPIVIDELDATTGVRVYRGPLLVIVAAKNGLYTDAARTIISTSNAAPKTRRVIEGTGAHGTDLLTAERDGERVTTFILDFLEAHRG
jgi:pimeloyl-ACP methyl ester carboxylesterase